MTKSRGEYLYAHPGDRLFENGKNFKHSQEIQEFAEKVLDKTFDTWLIVGRDINHTSFKETAGGDLMAGMVLCNLGKEGQSELAKTSIVKGLDQKSRLALILIDAVEGLCDSPDETENFFEALTETVKRLHSRDRGEEVEEKSKEREKLEILEGLLHTAVNSLETYEGKEKYLKSCLSSAVIARILEGDDEDLKDKTRNSMKAAILGKEEGEFASHSVTRIEAFVDLVLGAIDAGNSPLEIKELLKTFNKNL